ncbi:MAG TPA: YidC/Oxa1 family membrane protein insertase [Anaerolineales bacterium]|jgi:YidC/Oxa1 family membrane protein insertase|nr:YidC/Oxa1 family membrane protein insertase [Anaerolineales bacterium]
MKNTTNKTQTQVQQPELPQGLSRESLKTVAVIGILVLAFLRWNDVIAILVNVMILIYSLVGQNFGIALILFTILIRLVTWPLNAQQMKGAAAMQQLQNDKEWLAIQKKYAKDREKLAQEQMRIYREKGINPFGSCLPTLIQFPILFALIPSITYAIGSTPLSILKLSRSVYPFLDVAKLVPLNSKFLWMDLGLPERTLLFGLWSIPVLAVIVGLTTYIQTKLTMPPSTNPNDQAAATGKMMGIYMPIMLFFFSLNYASGLAVYFIISNILSIVQYSLMGKVNWRNLLPGGQKK